MAPLNTEPTPSETNAGPLTAASTRLIATAEHLDDAALSAPSLCAGWTRAHVLTHVARNADALTNLLAWARTGTASPAYPSREARNADIDAGVGRPTAEIVEDLRSSAARFTKAIMDMPEEGWERQVRPGAGAAGDPIPGRRVLWLRLRELEFHHVDLDAGYSPNDWPGAFVQRALPEVVRMFGRRDDVPAMVLVPDGRDREQIGSSPELTVAGSPATLLAWLTGRSDGTDLRVDPPGALPALPPWL